MHYGCYDSVKIVRHLQVQKYSPAMKEDVGWARAVKNMLGFGFFVVLLFGVFFFDCWGFFWFFALL